MKKIYILFFVVTLLFSCKKSESKIEEKQPIKEPISDVTIAFGSCNNQTLENKLWSAVLDNNPKLWIWGGDIIYSDTEDMSYLKKNYELQKNDSTYNNFRSRVEVIGTWDDHDYGMNDGGVEYSMKKEAQQLFLDFFDVDSSDVRRTREGVYTSKTLKVDSSEIKIIILDTRYFRSPLTKDTSSKKRYKPTENSENTMLGETQWNWLENELENSTADFNLVMSSVQFLSYEHGFESWGNMPSEVSKLEQLLIKTKAKNVIILSGDRHISEISSKNIEGLSYPLIDFTSSGLTHSYTNFTEEPNKYRVSNVVSTTSFGLLKFDFKNQMVTMEIRGENNSLLESFTQQY